MSFIFEATGWSSKLAFILYLLLPLLGVYLYTRLYYYRFRQHASWPKPQSSLLWGHLKVMHKAMQEFPPDMHTDAAIAKIWERLGKPPAFVLDFRPAEHVICVVASHEIAEKCVQPSKQFPYGFSKSPSTKSFGAILGEDSILTREGMEWKLLRKRLNPGFAFPHLIGLLPVILDRVQRLMDRLDLYAESGEEFKFGKLCNYVTYEIICTVALGLDWNSESDMTRQREIGRLYWKLLETYNSDNKSFFWTNPRVKRRRQVIAEELDSLIASYVKEKFFDSQGKALSTDNLSNTIIGLSLRGTETSTPSILKSTCDQVKLFIFAGQDTTSTLLQWATYELSRTPHILQALHTELDKIFGPGTGPDVIRQKFISQGAVVIGQMTYLSAIIKETLRLHPPGATARMAPPGSGKFIQLENGQEVCVDGVIMYNCQSLIHRDERVYGDSKDDFVPERWLNKEEAFPASAWRPFERGPKDCVGQGLANIQARVILACIVRRYDFFKVGLGEIDHSKNGRPILNHKGQYEVLSELYDTREITLKPVDGMRMRVKLSSK